MKNSTLAERIESRIKALGTNPSAVALEAGLSRSAVLDILKGKAANPRLDTLQKLTGPLKCTLDFLTGSTDSPKAPSRSDDFDFFGEPMRVLEGFTYRAPGKTFRSDPNFPSLRLEGWRATRYSVGDDSLDGVGIITNDIVEAAAPADGSEIVLSKGMLVVIKHTIVAARLEQWSGRVVMSASDNEIAFALRPSLGEPPGPIFAEYASEHSDLTPNTYQTKNGDMVEVIGVVTSIHRELQLPDISRKGD